MRLLSCFSAVMFCACLLASQANAKDRALIVSIDKYADNRLSDLPAGLAGNDAEAIQKLLVEKLGYKPEEIRVLRNEQATKAAILSALDIWLNPPNAEEIARKQTKLKGLEESGALDDKKRRKRRVKKRKKKKRVRPAKAYRSYFYFSGLGYFQADTDGDEKDGQDETLVPYDAKLKSPGSGDGIAGMISDDEIAALLWKYKLRHMTIVLDTGHSGLVTRSSNLGGQDSSHARVPRIVEAVRNITVDSWLEAHKNEGAFVDLKLPRGSLTVWSAVSPTQTALVAGTDDAPQGLFTSLYAEGIAAAKADANANGIVSNAELLSYVNEWSAAYCKVHRDRCEMGLQPRLNPPAAYGKSAWVDRRKVTHRRERRLTLVRLADYLGQEANGTVEIRQIPPSPLKVGADNIRYEVRSPTSGYLVLLNLTARGKLFQLYPNQYSGGDENGFAGPLQASKPLVVPEESYGVTFSATEPDKGHIVAVMTANPVRFDSAVTRRTIASVSPDEALSVYLAQLSAALHHPLYSGSVQANTDSARWSVTVLPYEILPNEVLP